jgi:hypothetical protein
MNERGVVVAVLVLAVGTYALRATGVFARGRMRGSNIQSWAEVAVVALLAGVTATSTLYEATNFGGWARAAGVAAGGLAAYLHAPVVIVVAVSVAVTTALRAAGVA